MVGRRILAAAATVALAVLVGAAQPARSARPATAAARSAGCTFLPRAAETPGEGLADARRALDSTGRPLRIAMLFATPAGLVPSESPDALYASLAPPVERWLAAASYGRARVVLTMPLHEWVAVRTLDTPAAIAAASGLADLSADDAVVAVLPEETGLSASFAQVTDATPRFGIVLAPHPAAASPRRPELWQVLDLDAGLCDAGVLVYDVETDAVPAAAPLRVLGADGACGGPLHVGASVTDAGVRVDVLGATSDGFRVRVSR